jgi:hypothetical protein
MIIYFLPVSLIGNNTVKNQMHLFTTKVNVHEIRFFNLQFNLIFSPNLSRNETPGGNATLLPYCIKNRRHD